MYEDLSTSFDLPKFSKISKVKRIPDENAGKRRDGKNISDTG
jgi:hypothetical protein